MKSTDKTWRRTKFVNNEGVASFRVCSHGESRAPLPALRLTIRRSRRKKKRAAGFNRRPVQRKRVRRECYWSGVVEAATRAAVNGTLPLPAVFWKIVPRWSVPNERPPVEPGVSGCASPK